MAKTKEPKVIRKLLLVRKADSKADLIDQAGLTSYLVGEPLKISPLAWEDESGLSHYGFRLEGMKLSALDELTKWCNNNHFVTLLHMDEETDVEKCLEGVGLRINELAD